MTSSFWTSHLRLFSFIRKSVTSSCTPSCRTLGALTSVTPVNFLGQEVLSDDNAYYAQTTSWIAAVEKDPQDYQKELLADYQEFTDLVTEAKGHRHRYRCTLCRIRKG